MYFKNNRTALIFLLAMLVVAPIKAQVALAMPQNSMTDGCSG